MNNLRAFLVTLALALVLGIGAGGVFSNAASTLLTGATGAAVQAAPAQDAPAAPPAVPLLDASGVVRQASPAVVTVVNRMARGSASGSGFIIDQQGYIVTNNHVVEGARSLQVIYHDGRQAAARLVGADPVNDIAVIDVDGTVPGTVRWGDSARLEAGQPVVAIGSALGDFRNTVTVGVVSGLNRRLGGGPDQMNGLIQTDAAINHGNSGGPLLNMSAEVVGVNTLVVRGGGMGDQAEGLGFAISANTAHTIADQLIAGGSVARPYLGVTYQMLTPQSAAFLGVIRTSGAYLNAVAAGSPAARAGLRAGDIITAIDGQALTESRPLQSVLLAHKPGDRLSLTVARGGGSTETTLTVTLGQQ
jgi:2-alkenal reductase